MPPRAGGSRGGSRLLPAPRVPWRSLVSTAAHAWPITASGELWTLAFGIPIAALQVAFAGSVAMASIVGPKRAGPVDKRRDGTVGPRGCDTLAGSDTARTGAGNRGHSGWSLGLPRLATGAAQRGNQRPAVLDGPAHDRCLRPDVRPYHRPAGAVDLHRGGRLYRRHSGGRRDRWAVGTGPSKRRPGRSSRGDGDGGGRHRSGPPPLVRGRPDLRPGPVPDCLDLLADQTDLRCPLFRCDCSAAVPAHSGRGAGGDAPAREPRRALDLAHRRPRNHGGWGARLRTDEQRQQRSGPCPGDRRPADCLDQPGRRGHRDRRPNVLSDRLLPRACRRRAGLRATPLRLVRARPAVLLRDVPDLERPSRDPEPRRSRRLAARPAGSSQRWVDLVDYHHGRHPRRHRISAPSPPSSSSSSRASWFSVRGTFRAGPARF